MRIRLPHDGAEAGLKFSRNTGRNKVKIANAHATNYEYLELQLK
jgi:hypothetical protein